MSDRPCNYCVWRRMKREGYRKATKAERRVLWDKPDAPYSGEGVVIVDADGKFASWFMELPDACAC